MHYIISPDRRTLTIYADEDDRLLLQALPRTPEEMAEMGAAVTIHSDAAMFDAFEQLICNSELQWIAPEVCGDLTEAPILGIWGEAETRDSWRVGDGTVCLGCEGVFNRGSVYTVAPVVERWAYMSYQVRSPLEDLRDKGQAVFIAP